MKNLAVIPARGGSKRIKRKNIKPFLGKPMISYAIEIAIQFQNFDQIVVSSECDEILEVASSFGQVTKIKRPKELSDDVTPTVPVIEHAIKELEATADYFENICCIYPCAPFVVTDDIQNSLELLLDSNKDYSFPIVEYSSPIQRALSLDKNNNVSSIEPKFELVRTQDLSKSFYDAGQFYWGTRRAWATNPKVHSNSLGLPVPQWRAVDFDTPEDWRRGELLYKALNY